MKKRSKQNATRALITLLVVSFLGVIALLVKVSEQTNKRSISQVQHDLKVQACEEAIRPLIKGQVLSWHPMNYPAISDDKSLIFIANVDEKKKMYTCYLSGSATVEKIVSSD